VCCGDARKRKSFTILLGGQKATMVITDAPYNVVINGNVSGLGRTEHASSRWLQARCRQLIHCVLMRVMRLLVEKPRRFDPLSLHGLATYLRNHHRGTKSLHGAEESSLWNKTNGGWGAFNRSKHELVFIFKTARPSHQSRRARKQGGIAATSGLRGMNTMREGRLEELAMHPTVKPSRSSPTRSWTVGRGDIVVAASAAAARP